MRWLFSCRFSQLFPTQNAAPSTRHGDCSTAHQRRLAKLPQVVQHKRQVVHRGERHAVLGAQQVLVGLQASAPQRLGLGEGAAVHQHLGEPRPWIATGAEKFPKLSWGESFWLCGFIDPNLWWENEILGFELFWFHLSSCYRLYFLMLFDACCKYCCNMLQSTAFTLRLCGMSGCKSLVTRQYSSWLNSTCLLMCSSLWRDWGPHRLSAKSASPCSGPNLSAVASARHRNLGPWWCLSHGCAYHMAMRWSTMSPTWKTNQFQENGQRYAKSSRCGTAPSFSQKLATGLQ